MSGGRRIKALIYSGPGQRQRVEKPKPEIEKPTDIIVKIGKTTIWGTYLHILKGDVPMVAKGCTPGHKGVGIVEAVGAKILGLNPAESVLISYRFDLNDILHAYDVFSSASREGAMKVVLSA